MIHIGNDIVHSLDDTLFISLKELELASSSIRFGLDPPLILSQAQVLIYLTLHVCR